MKLSFSVATAVACLASNGVVAFAPATSRSSFINTKAASTSAATTSNTVVKSSMNGWVPNENEFCYGLPGAVAPFSDGFDPFDISEREDFETIKTFRESEVTHGRVAMLAVLGFLVTEQPLKFHPLFNTGSKDIGPAIRHLDEVRATTPFFFELLAVAIGASELRRALIGWEVGTTKNLKSDYYPGDIGFDPLGLKPSDPEAFAKMQTKELNNGRLAMLAAIGFIVQELINGKEILVNLGVAPDNFDPSTLPVEF